MDGIEQLRGDKLASRLGQAATASAASPNNETVEPRRSLRNARHRRAIHPFAIRRLNRSACGNRTSTTTGLRILVVDDNRYSADSFAMLLKMTGNETHTAYDGLEAVEAAALRPDVVLLDIGLPKLNGYDACRKIREQSWGKGIVLIALTGWGQDEDRRKCYVYPAVLESYMDGSMLNTLKQRADQEMAESLPKLRAEEAAVLTLLRQRLNEDA